MKSSVPAETASSVPSSPRITLKPAIVRPPPASLGRPRSSRPQVTRPDVVVAVPGALAEEATRLSGHYKQLAAARIEQSTEATIAEKHQAATAARVRPGTTTQQVGGGGSGGIDELQRRHVSNVQSLAGGPGDGGPGQRTGDVLIEDLHLSELSSWPALSATKLLEYLNRMLVALDLEQGHAKRCARVTAILDVLGRELQTYAPVFSALSVEIKGLVAHCEEIAEASKLEKDTIDAIKASHRLEIAKVRRELEADIAAQEMGFRQRLDELETIKKDLVQLKRERDAAVAVQTSLTSHTHEMASQKKHFESLANKFAIRNKELTDRLPALERSAATEMERAHQADLAAKRYSSALADLEHRTTEEAKVAKATIQRLQELLSESNHNLRTTQTTLTVVRAARAKLETDCHNLKRELESQRVNFE